MTHGPYIQFDLEGDFPNNVVTVTDLAITPPLQLFRQNISEIVDSMDDIILELMSDYYLSKSDLQFTPAFEACKQQLAFMASEPTVVDPTKSLDYNLLIFEKTDKILEG
jgi:hypothetical protein